LDEKYGFLPIVMPITEPAVGYGAAGILAFLSKPLGAAKQGLGRPNITIAGGFGTENGTWGVMAADMRYWLDDRLQTLAAFVYASVNLDFHGIGKDSVLDDNPLRYTLEPVLGAARGKYRLGDTLIWAGLGYAFSSTEVKFEAPDSTPELPDYDRRSNIGGFSPNASFDSRDNMFTPTRGTFLEGTLGVFAKAFGGDDAFQRLSLVAIQYFALPFRLYFGVRGDAGASFGDAPFYMRPYVSLRGVPVMRYQGEEVAQFESELRWQFWGRFSLLGFGGAGWAWNDFEKVESPQSVASGGTGFRYEIARSYGIHMGVDVAFSRDTTAFYVQAGSAWARP
jgi:outer membrane protein assembly factor BamA